MMDEQRKIEELERLLTGTGGVADDELAGLFLLARGVAASGAAERLREAPVRPEFRSALRTQLLEHSSGTVSLGLHRRVRASVQARNATMQRSLRSIVAVAAAAMVMLVGGALVAAAQGAAPDSALYRIKIAREDLALRATFGRVPKAQRNLEIARERYRELKVLAERRVGQAKWYITALKNMDAHTLDATSLMITEFRVSHDLGVLRELNNFAIAQRQGLESLAGDVPPAARPKIRSSIELVSAVENRVVDVLAGCPCSADALVPTANAAPGTPGRPVCGCKAAPSSGSTSSNGTPAPGSSKQPESGPPPESPPPSATGPIPPITGTGIEETVNDIVNDLLDNLGVTPPSPSASPVVPLPALP